MHQRQHRVLRRLMALILVTAAVGIYQNCGDIGIIGMKNKSVQLNESVSPNPSPGSPPVPDPGPGDRVSTPPTLAAKGGGHEFWTGAMIPCPIPNTFNPNLCWQPPTSDPAMMNAYETLGALNFSQPPAITVRTEFSFSGFRLASPFGGLRLLIPFANSELNMGFGSGHLEFSGDEVVPEISNSRSLMTMKSSWVSLDCSHGGCPSLLSVSPEGEHVFLSGNQGGHWNYDETFDLGLLFKTSPAGFHYGVYAGVSSQGRAYSNSYVQIASRADGVLFSSPLLEKLLNSVVEHGVIKGLPTQTIAYADYATRFSNSASSCFSGDWYFVASNGMTAETASSIELSALRISNPQPLPTSTLSPHGTLASIICSSSEYLGRRWVAVTFLKSGTVPTENLAVYSVDDSGGTQLEFHNEEVPVGLSSTGNPVTTNSKPLLYSWINGYTKTPLLILIGDKNYLTWSPINPSKSLLLSSSLPNYKNTITISSQNVFSNSGYRYQAQLFTGEAVGGFSTNLSRFGADYRVEQHLYIQRLSISDP